MEKKNNLSEESVSITIRTWKYQSRNFFRVSRHNFGENSPKREMCHIVLGRNSTGKMKRMKDIGKEIVVIIEERKIFMSNIYARFSTNW